jgi:hypothetical protein
MKLLLAFLVGALAFGQTGTVKTREQLYTHFADGQAAGAIVPERMRDLVATALFGPASSIDGEGAVFDSTSGKLLKRFSGTGLVLSTSGVFSVDSGLQFNTSTKSLGVFGPIVSGQTSNYLGKILLNGITSGTLTINPADAAGTWTWTLPANDGDSGQYLQTNGSGVTSWATVSGTGNMVNTGTPTATAIPKYSDTSGTAIAPSGVLIDASDNLTGVTSITIDGTGASNITAISAPAGTPAAGTADFYVDSTTKRLATKNDAGLAVNYAPSADPVFTSSVNVPNGTGPTVDAAGEVAVDTTTDQFQFYGGAKRALPSIKHMSFVMPAPVAGDDFLLMKAPYGMTILTIKGVLAGSTNVVGQLQECDSSGASCADLDSDITFNGGEDADDGTLTDSTITSGNWIAWKTTSVSATPTFLTVTVTYRVIPD